MESLASEASQELATRLSVDNITTSAINTFHDETAACIKRVQDTTQLTTKIQSETNVINEMLTSLKQKSYELQSTFDKIDQLEVLVNKVKDTYNAVAENLDQMERAVSASTQTSSFRLAGRSDHHHIPFQPYFPPPHHVEIFKTDELFSSFSL